MSPTFPIRPSSNSSATHRRVAGIILLVATLLTVAFMAHHPTVGGNPAIGDALDRVARLRTPAAIVHGALIALMLLTLWCLGAFVDLRGVRRPLITSGAVAYGAGVVCMIGAALVSGFVMAELAMRLPHESPVDLQIAGRFLVLSAILNQACANCGAVAMSVGVGLWSIDLLRDRGTGRWVGILGCAVAALPTAALLSGAMRLDVHGALDFVVLQGAWNLAVAGWMILDARRDPMRQ